MEIFETVKDAYFISTDKSKLDISVIHNYLSNESYWAKNIPLETVKQSIDGSFCFGLFINKSLEEQRAGDKTYTQIGFARVITDHATFAYLADVFILEAFREKGLAKWLMKEIFTHARLQGLRRWLLATQDAHGLYSQFGFTAIDNPERIMGLKPFDEYPKTNS